MKIKLQKNFKRALVKAFMLLILGIGNGVSWGQTTFSWRNDQSPADNASWLSTTPFYFWNGTTGAVPGGGEILFFDGSVGTTMTNNLSATNRFRINFGSSSAASRTINGSTSNVFFDFSNAIPAIYNGSGVAHNINFPIEIGNTSLVTSPNCGFEINAESGNLTFGSTFSAANSTNGAKVLVLRATSSGTGIITLNGIISNGSGTINLSKVDNNTAILTAANTYTGTTTISGGTLRLNRTGGTTIPNTNNITVSGGTLRVSSDQTIANLDLSSAGNLTVDAGVTLTITGTYTGGTGTINNLGTIVLQGASAQTFPGASATINNGTANTLTNLTINNSAGVTLNRTLSVAGTLTLSAGTFTNSTNLTMVSGATITRTNGALSAVPSIASGSYSVIYNGNTTITSATTSTPELNPSGGGSVGNITINLSDNTRTVGTSIGATISSVGGVTITSGTLLLGNTLTLTGNWSMANSGAGFTHNNQRVNFEASGAQTITVTGVGGGSIAFQRLGMQTTGCVLSLGASTTASISNQLLLTRGTLNGTGFSMGNSSTVFFQTTGSISNPLAYGTNVNVSITMSGIKSSGNELLPSSGSINNFSIGGSGFTYTLSNSININGDVDINVTNTLSLGSNNISLNGNFRRASGATFTAGTGTVTFNGSIARSITVASGGSITFYNLTLNNSAGLTIGASTAVSINNNLTLTAGDLSIGASNTLTLNGGLTCDATNSLRSTATSNLTLTGTAKTLFFDAANNNLRNLDITGSNTMTLGNALNITGGSTFGVVTVGSGATLATGGFLTLRSDATGTASIGNSAGTISGNVTAERFIPALGVRGRFRFLASPVAGRTIADWMNNFYITGPGTGTTLGAANSNGWHTSNANIINALVPSTSVLTYNEATTSGDLNTGWTSLTSSSQAITPGLGFRAFLRGTNNGTPTNVTYTPQIGANANSQTQAAFTIALSGEITNTVNAGTITLPATFNSSGTIANDGWNLVGNPYPSTIDWNAASGWTKTNIGGTIWIFNPSSNSYGNWDGATPTNSVTRYISSGQAFFVKASASPTFSCTEAVKVSLAGASIFKSAEINTLRIGLVKDESNKDETVIRFMEGKNNEFSEEDDVTKYYNPTVNVSSYFGADKYASVNYLKNELNEDKIIPISAWVDEEGSYKLNFTGMSDFTLTKNIFLKDKFLNTITDVEINPTVDFIITSDSNSKGDNRFEIIFAAKGSTNTKDDFLKISSTNLSAYPNPATDVLNINISNANFKNSEVVVYNISGTEILKTNMASSNTQLNIETLSNGVYFVKVTNQNGFNKTVKFVK